MGRHLRPLLAFLQTGVGRHVDSRSGNGPRTRAAAHAVAYLSSRARGGAIERLHSGWEVVDLGFERNHALDIRRPEVVACALVGGGKLLDNRPLRESHIVFVGGKYLAGILRGGLLDHGKERTLHLLTVDDECAAEYLVAAVLGVDLGETEYLGVGEWPPVLFFYLVQILHFLGRQCQSLLLVVGFEVFHVPDGLRTVLHREYLLVEPVVHALQHWVVVGLFRAHGEVFLYTRNAVKTHVLSDGDKFPFANLDKIAVIFAGNGEIYAKRTDNLFFRRIFGFSKRP